MLKQIAVALVLLVAPAAAQTPTGAATDQTTFGDWAVRCFPIKSPAPCDMFQAAVERASQRRIMSISIAYAPAAKRYIAKVIVPLGAKLPDGLAVVVDGRRDRPLAFSRCEADGCYVETALDTSVVERLSAAKTASFAATGYGGAKLTFPLSLNGFIDARQAMMNLAASKGGTSADPPATAPAAVRKLHH